jgi:hypothetical protein
MPVNIGTDGSLYNTTIPDLTDVANVQNAFRFYHYGNNAGVPATSEAPSANSIYSYLKGLNDKFGTIVTDRVLISSTVSGQIRVVSSDISTTKLGYLSDVTSAIQAQIDLKAPLADPTITGSLSTSSSSFNLINTNATTVGFAGAATTLAIGASSGTTTVNNSLIAGSSLTVNSSLAANGGVTVPQQKNALVASGYNSASGAFAQSSRVVMTAVASGSATPTTRPDGTALQAGDVWIYW